LKKYNQSENKDLKQPQNRFCKRGCKVWIVTYEVKLVWKRKNHPGDGDKNYQSHSKDDAIRYLPFLRTLGWDAFNMSFQEMKSLEEGEQNMATTQEKVDGEAGLRHWHEPNKVHDQIVNRLPSFVDNGDCHLVGLKSGHYQ